MPVMDSTPVQSTRTGVPVIFSSTVPRVRPTIMDSSRPSTMGIAVCHSTDRLSVRRRVPKATRAESSFLRSRNCSSCETSRLAPISASTHAAPTNRPVRMASKRLVRSVSAQVTVSARRSMPEAVFRTRSCTSGTDWSSLR